MCPASITNNSLLKVALANIVADVQGQLCQDSGVVRAVPLVRNQSNQAKHLSATDLTLEAFVLLDVSCKMKAR